MVAAKLKRRGAAWSNVDVVLSIGERERGSKARKIIASIKSACDSAGAAFISAGIS